MVGTIEEIFHRFGTDMTVSREGQEQTVRGFFRAVDSVSWQSVEHRVNPLGQIARRQYTYLGPAAAGVQEGDVLIVGGRDYLLRRVENYTYRGRAIYQWGLCVEKGGGDDWGTL